jgi:hypothetical protein
MSFYRHPRLARLSPAIWLRSLSKMALINGRTPITYSSPIILIKSSKIYNKERLLKGRDHKFVRMRRIRAIPCFQFEAATFPAHFVQKLHISQERVMLIQYLHQQTISHAPIYTGRREDREISGKYVCSIAISTNKSNWGAKVRPPGAETWAVSTIFNESYMHFRDRLLCHLPIHLYNDFKE